MDAADTPKPHVLSDDGNIVTVMTAQGETVPLDRSNPQQAEMIQAFEDHGMAGEDSAAAHVAGVQADETAGTTAPDIGSGTPLMPPQAGSGDMGQQLQAQNDINAGATFDAMPPTSVPGVVTPPSVAPVAPAAVDQTGRPAPVAATPAPAAPAASPMAQQMQSKSSQDTEYKGISSKDRANLDKAARAEKEAVTAEAEAKPTMQDAEAATAYGNQIQAIQDRQAAREQAQRDYSDEMRTRLDTAAQDLGKMKVDPNFFGRLDTGNKLLAGASIMLGAFGQAYSHSDKNVGLEVVEKAIDRDIDAQKTNINNAKGAFEAQKGGYDAFLKATGDERLATIAETQRQLDVLKSTLMKNAAGNANEAASASLKKALADIDSKYAVLEADKSQVIDKKSQSGEVSMGAGKKPEVPKEEGVAIAEKERLIAELKNIRAAAAEAQGKNQIGPQARLSAIARTLGMDEGEDAATVNAQLKQYTASRLHDLTGRVTPAETKIMESSFPSVHDNPKIFNRLLDQEISSAERELNQRKSQWAGYSGLPNSTITTTPDAAALKNKVGFKK